MEITVDQKEFKTRDMNLAACLMVDGILYLRVEKDIENERRLVFVFDLESGKKKEEVERIQSQRANATHVVSSVHYDEKLRSLKSIIHGQ
jgi:3-dehydroquinate dehydratase